MRNFSHDGVEVSVGVIANERTKTFVAEKFQPKTIDQSILFEGSGGVKKIIRVKIIDGSIEISVEEKMVETITIDDDVDDIQQVLSSLILAYNAYFRRTAMEKTVMAVEKRLRRICRMKTISSDLNHCHGFNPAFF